MANSFNSKASLAIDNVSHTIYRLDAVYKKYPQAERLPFSLKILLENLLRNEGRSQGHCNDALPREIGMRQGQVQGVVGPFSEPL